MQDVLCQLREKIAAFEPARPAPGKGFTLGHPEVDAALGGQLPRACLHEVYAREAGDVGAATGFALALARRVSQAGRPIVWVRSQLAALEAGAPYGAGLREFGLDPDAVLLVAAKNENMALRAALEALRSTAPAALILELWGKARLLDLTATRRLMLSASESGVTGFMLRIAVAPQPSSALTRWLVAASPSTGLQAGAPSHPAFDITLERHRAGIPPRRWRVEWNRDRTCFDSPGADFRILPANLPAPHPAGRRDAVAALSGAVVPFAFDRQAAPDKEKLRRTG